MQLPILIEPIGGGGFRARVGEPFALSAEGDSAEAATREVERLIAQRLRSGARLATITVPNGSSSPPPLPFPADELYKTDLSYKALQEAIEEYRRLDNEAEGIHPGEPAGS
ncbi:MAG TPA: hypothetical protein VKA46_39005 [Gemmataceae bacterium]|nr:hypothetical protein [Gemmataceae bacterium]